MRLHVIHNNAPAVAERTQAQISLLRSEGHTIERVLVNDESHNTVVRSVKHRYLVPMHNVLIDCTCRVLSPGESEPQDPAQALKLAETTASLMRNKMLSLQNQNADFEVTIQENPNGTARLVAAYIFQGMVATPVTHSLRCMFPEPMSVVKFATHVRAISTIPVRITTLAEGEPHERYD